MNYIKIYFALPDELEKERDELADYIRSLNDFYHERDIFFEVNFSEEPFDSFDDFPSASDNEENQEQEQRDTIRESNYFYLIFGCHDDENIREKFDVALEEFGKNGTPKIYTYFKKLPEGVEAEQGIKAFIDRLDQAIGHYYSQFVHIDSVKLNILLELTNTSKNGDKLEFEDGHATINGTKVLPLDNIPIYQCNESLQELKTEKARLEQEFAQAAVNYAQNPNDQEAFNKMMDLSGERNRVSDKIHEIEKGMLGLCNTISEMRHSDRKLTWREVEAGKRLDIGDYDGALMILRDDQREKELAQAETIANEGIERIRGYIAENRMIISALEAKGRTLDTLEELYARYEKNTELAIEYYIELDCVYNHVSFLYNQKEFSRAIELGEWIKPYFQEDDKKVVIFNLIGLCYHSIHDFQKAKVFYEFSLNISRKLAQENPEIYEDAVTSTCNNLANLLSDLHQYEEAEKLYRETLEIYMRLVQKDPEKYESEVATIYNNLANLLSYLHQYEEAEKLYREALEINRRLARRDSETYGRKLAYTCGNMANLLSDLHQYEESEKLYREALEINRRLARKNPEVYENIVAMICHNLARLLNHVHRYDEAEPLHQEALEIYRRLAKKDFEAYGSDLASACFNFGNLMSDTYKYNEAEELYVEALGIFWILAQKSPEVYERDVAVVCSNLAIILCELHQYEDAEKLYYGALEIYSRLAQDHPEIYKKDVAGASYNSAHLMMKLHRYEEAEKLCCQSYILFKSLAEKEPETYESMCNELGSMIHEIRDLQQ